MLALAAAIGLWLPPSGVAAAGGGQMQAPTPGGLAPGSVAGARSGLAPGAGGIAPPPAAIPPAIAPAPPVPEAALPGQATPLDPEGAPAFVPVPRRRAPPTAAAPRNAAPRP